MESAILFFVDAIRQLISVLESIRFEFGGFTVNFLGLVFGFLVFGFVASVVWKGARA